MKSLLFITSVFLGLNLSGCGSEATGPERVIVTGSVTFDGKPVSQGEIWFIPAAGREAPQAGAIIKEGQYRVENKGGVPIGACQVKITAERPQEEVKIVSDGGPEEIPTTQYLPPRFNEKTELTTDIQSGSDPVRKDFDLKS
ncbi:MAG: hypothetical protein CME31_21240 [Gimesia sp.]|uniref:Carboxypeptidase regulatory-like domain-containing protein n=1 Tax=Gimesia maris TaxID=122 RepID=A0A3D3R5Q5_9PLAN|nr:hypothetical protein [Gimesia sp.]HCO24153.1 hypothetical protein [Gimesia maris]|tara:strand:- start:33006 stop:33431 length:426 start_codon:yes stop_codon:yes gene_type:complete